MDSFAASTLNRFENIGFAVVSLETGEIVWCGSSFARLLERDFIDILGKNKLSLIVDKDTADIAKKIEAARGKGYVRFLVKCSFKMPFGREKTFNLEAVKTDDLNLLVAMWHCHGDCDEAELIALRSEVNKLHAQMYELAMRIAGNRAEINISQRQDDFSAKTQQNQVGENNSQETGK